MIKDKLNESGIILFLVSPDFLASDYINDTEIKSALDNNKIIIIPIIIRPIDMELLKINYFQAIPTGAKPVVEWDSRDKAWNDVIIALKKVFKKINAENPQDLPHRQSGNKYATDSKRSYSADTIMKWFFVFLIAVCICVFLYGMVQHDSYYFFTSVAGMGIGSFAYFLLRRQFSH